jgi:hypothetical protein
VVVLRDFGWVCWGSFVGELRVLLSLYLFLVRCFHLYTSNACRGALRF